MTTGTTHTWSSILGDLVRDGSISRDGAAWAMGEIMAGSATNAQIGGFAVGLRAAGETADSVAGLVETMLEHAAPVEFQGRCVDIVGTGGDQAHTVNISSMAAIVTAGAGVTVAKHGNRAASSSCGSADVLEELGVKLMLDGPGVVRCINEAGIGFFFAAAFHAGMRFAGPPRKELGIPTVFNFLGPLSNPARPSAMAVGCADLRMAPILADVMRLRGVSALVFRGDDGLDELTTTTTSTAWLVAPGSETISAAVVDPTRFGIPVAQAADLRGGDREFNAGVVRDLLAGKTGPIRDAVVLNAASAIAAFDGAPSDQAALDEGLARGIERAEQSIDSGRSAEVLRRWVEVSNAD